MVNDEIVKFISSGLKRGLSNEEIHMQLLAQNYPDCDIIQAENYLLGDEGSSSVFNQNCQSCSKKKIKILLIILCSLLVGFIIFYIIKNYMIK